MLKRYYQEERDRLSELTGEFLKAHPALGPMLGGTIGDPDLARFFDGTAFQLAMLRQRLDDDFPEIIQEVMQHVCAPYLQPIPCSTIVAYTPKESMRQSQEIEAGAVLDATTVEGTSCRFTTTRRVELHPLRLVEASFGHLCGECPAIRLRFTLNGLSLSQWRPHALRLFLAGEYGKATDLYLLLRRKLRRIVLSPLDHGAKAELSPGHLVPVGFDDDDLSLPSALSYPGFRLLRDYFLSPDQFLFFDITGWERWTGRGDGQGFEVILELEALDASAPQIASGSFVLFATPACNRFRHDANPIAVSQRTSQYLISPHAKEPSHYLVNSVEAVCGHLRGSARPRIYKPFGIFNQISEGEPTYSVSVRRAVVGERLEVYLKINRGEEARAETETLQLELTCTNGSLPESLRIGDLCVPTARSSESASFSNITPMTPALLPPMEPWMLWRLIAHLSMNSLYLENAQHLRSLLELYIFSGTRNSAAVSRSRRGIEGVEELSCRPFKHLDRGELLRGRDLRVTLRQDHFASAGDMYLFGCVLERFFSGYASINSITRTTLTEALKGEVYQWPIRLGSNRKI